MRKLIISIMLLFLVVGCSNQSLGTITQKDISNDTLFKNNPEASMDVQDTFQLDTNCTKITFKTYQYFDDQWVLDKTEDFVREDQESNMAIAIGKDLNNSNEYSLYFAANYESSEKDTESNLMLDISDIEFAYFDAKDSISIKEETPIYALSKDIKDISVSDWKEKLDSDTEGTYIITITLGNNK